MEALYVQGTAARSALACLIMKPKKTNRVELLQELNHVRQLSLAASRQNDFRTVARLTSDALRLNRAIQDLDVEAQ